MKQKKIRCPYCVVDGEFRALRVLANGRKICEGCGHIVFPDDVAFLCPCAKCWEISFSERIRRLGRKGRLGAQGSGG